MNCGDRLARSQEWAHANGLGRIGKGALKIILSIDQWAHPLEPSSTGSDPTRGLHWCWRQRFPCPTSGEVARTCKFELPIPLFCIPGTLRTCFFAHAPSKPTEKCLHENNLPAKSGESSSSIASHASNRRLGRSFISSRGLHRLPIPWAINYRLPPVSSSCQPHAIGFGTPTRLPGRILIARRERGPSHQQRSHKYSRSAHSIELPEIGGIRNRKPSTN